MRGTKQSDCTILPRPLMAVRRSLRLALRTSHLGALQDLHQMGGEEESAEMKTEDEYSLGEFCGRPPHMHFLGLGLKLLALLQVFTCATWRGSRFGGGSWVAFVDVCSRLWILEGFFLLFVEF